MPSPATRGHRQHWTSSPTPAWALHIKLELFQSWFYFLFHSSVTHTSSLGAIFFNEFGRYLKKRQQQWKEDEIAKKEAEKAASIPPGHVAMSESERQENLAKLQNSKWIRASSSLPKRNWFCLFTTIYSLWFARQWTQQDSHQHWYNSSPSLQTELGAGIV